MSFLRNITNEIDARLNAGDIEYRGDMNFYFDYSGNLVDVIQADNNVFAVKEVEVNLYSINNITPDTQPFADRNLNTYVFQIDVFARVEDRISIEDDLERFSDTFYNDVVVIDGIKVAFKVPNIVPTGLTNFQNGLWLKGYRGTISVTTGKNVHFADEDTYEISEDNVTFEAVQLVSLAEDRSNDLILVEGIGESEQTATVKQNAFQEEVSFIKDDTSTIQNSLIDAMRNDPDKIFYTRLTEGTTVNNSRKMNISTIRNVKANGVYDSVAVVFKVAR